MKKILLSLSFILIAVCVFAQTEPRLHPAQIGAYGSSNNDILVSNGTTTEFKSIATLGISNQTITNTSDATSHTVTLSASGGTIQLVEGSGITLTTTGTSGAGVLTIAATDNSITNEIQTISASGSGSNYAIDLSNSGGSVSLVAGTNITIARSSNTLTFSTSGSADGSATNEGILGVAAGSGTTSVITSNTSGAVGVTITAGTGLSISETTSADGGTITLTNSAPDQTVALTGAGITAISGTYPNFTITSTEVDGSVTNEAQTLSRGSLTVNTVSLTTAGGAGGGTVNVEDELTIEEFTPTAGATSVTTSAATPASENKIRVERNGIVQNVGASKGVSSITNEGNTATVINLTRAISTGEIIRVIFPKQ